MSLQPQGLYECKPIVIPDDCGNESEEGSQSQRRVRRKCTTHGKYPTIRIKDINREKDSAEIPEYREFMTPGNPVTYALETTNNLDAMNFEVVGGAVKVQTRIDGSHKLVTAELKEGADLSTGKHGIVVTSVEDPEVTLARISLCLKQDTVQVLVKPCASASSDAEIRVPLHACVTFHVKDDSCIRVLTPAFEQYYLSSVSTSTEYTGSEPFELTNYHHVFKARCCGTSNIVWYNKKQEGDMTPLVQIRVTIVDDGNKTPTICL